MTLAQMCSAMHAYPAYGETVTFKDKGEAASFRAKRQAHHEAVRKRIFGE